MLLPFIAFTALLFFPVFHVIVGFAYRTLTLASSSATWGMQLMAIEFRNRHGRHFDLPTAALHTFGYSVSISTAFIQLISIVCMLANAKGQGLTDMLLGTVAVNRSDAI